LEDAIALCGRESWSEAATLLKHRLLLDPHDVVSHYYLGQCYGRGFPFYPGAAQGELRRAIQLTETGALSESLPDALRHGQTGSAAEAMQVLGWTELGSLYIRMYAFENRMGVSRDKLTFFADKLGEAVQHLRTLAPGTPETARIEQALTAVNDALGNAQGNNTPS